jgi:hypothetical protein
VILEYITTKNNNKQQKMVNYANSKVYKIEAINAIDGDTDIYIASTTKFYLSERMVCHRRDYIQWKNGNPKIRNITSFYVFDKYGVENCRIVLLEKFPCTSRDELHARESLFIRSLKCVNKVIPNRTREEYRLENKEHLLQKDREYYHKNIIAIKERKSEPTLCECGKSIARCGMAKHKRTKAHIDFISAMNDGSASVPTDSI